MKRWIFGIVLSLCVLMPAQQQTSSPLPTQDQSTGATGSAVPTKAGYVGGFGSGSLKGLITCDNSAVVTAAAASTTQIVALSGSTVIYVCGFSVSGGGAAGTLQWKYGTGTSCGTGTTNLTGAYTTAIGQAITYGGGLGTIFRTTTGQALCVTMVTASATAAGVLSYTQF